MFERTCGFDPHLAHQGPTSLRECAEFGDCFPPDQCKDKPDEPDDGDDREPAG